MITNLSISPDIQQNIQKIKEITGNSSDITVRLIQGGIAESITLAILFVNGLSDINVIHNDILKPLLFDEERDAGQHKKKSDPYTVIKDKVLAVGNVKQIDQMGDIVSALFSGNTVILMDGWKQGIVANSSKMEQRGVEEPSSQTVIRGPKEGFTESLSTNIALLRRRIKSPDLWLVDKKIGRVTQTNVTVMYVKGIAEEGLVNEVIQRLDKIDSDSILESGYLEEFIQDKTITSFPTIMNSERPDSVAGSLLEGKIAILVDGTPFVLIVPVTFFEFFQTSEDYYQRYDIATFLRMMRFAAYAVSMLLPALYIAIITYHQEMLPTTLLISLAAQREGVPFPTFVEALLMEITLEILREAGVRMPRAIGPAISIVGALVLGQAAVQAGIISAAMVIVVSFTAISSFVAPAYNIAISARLIRFGFMLLAATLGLLGLMSGLLALLIHLAGLQSFGKPYLAPVTPFIPSDFKDTFVRVPWLAMLKRSRLYSSKNRTRQEK